MHESSGALATLPNLRICYEKVTELVKESLRRKVLLRELMLEKNLMSEKEFDNLLMGARRPNL